VDGKAGAPWDHLRTNSDLRREIYSFLTAYDRVHLGEVDRAFQNDELRCNVVGIYGEERFDLLEAFLVLQRWKNSEDSPRFQNNMEGSWGREGHGGMPESWFTLESGYDLNRVEVRRRQGALRGEDAFATANPIHNFLLFLGPISGRRTLE
jgi:hypothetical protein